MVVCESEAFLERQQYRDRLKTTQANQQNQHHRVYDQLAGSRMLQTSDLGYEYRNILPNTRVNVARRPCPSPLTDLYIIYESIVPVGSVVLTECKIIKVGADLANISAVVKDKASRKDVPAAFHTRFNNDCHRC
ncbi:hypothetical protein EC957_003638 [Mortierella hygrophila]|uniref:Uncharacterized protein n=1 Tax=Mortierella hygrophila TaxID=979708 RepID=A0A9P6F2G0_9FUNG|nr:hypothetical protein EC957_003638 [Mortierella hygrophila]